MKRVLYIGHVKISLSLLLCILLLVVSPVWASPIEEPVSVTGITLEQTELTFTVGDEAETLRVVINPIDATDQTVIWTSSDEEVAAVVDGVVTPLTAGTAFITATAGDGEFEATCEVTVNAELVPVTGIILDQTELILTVGVETETLIATTEPENATDRTVVWTSSDEGVATVADGVVTPLTAGTAFITATAVDGEFEATCAVTVNAELVPVTGIILDQTELILTVGEQPEPLIATVVPGDATNQTVVWSSSNEIVATVDDGFILPLEPGVATISATTLEGGYTAICEVIVNEAEFLLDVIQTGANLEYPLVCSDSDEVIVNYAANADGSYEWYYSEDYSTISHNAYVAGNSGKKTACVSNISLTVNGAGSFSFDYMTSTYSSGDGYALYYKVGEPITQGNYQTADNYDRYTYFRGTMGWTNEQFNIEKSDLDENDQAVIFIAYVRTGILGPSDNMVAIANVCFTSGQKVLTLDVDDEDYGYVTDADNHTYSESENIINYESGDIVKLTAVPEEGARFYGWVDGDGKFLTTDETYSFMISSDTSLRAVFAADGYYAAQRNGEFYTFADGGLTKALADAQPGDIISVLENQTLLDDATVPSDAILYIPYSATFDPDGNADGSKDAGLYNASTKIATADKTYRTLTIDSDVTLMVHGTLNIGSVIGRPGQDYQGHTSGWHGKIENNGDIVIGNGGILDCWGIITGNGTVIAESGGTVYEPFIVYDFAGGSNTVDLYLNENQSPFGQYTLQNIQTELVINSGSLLYARCNLYASDAYNKTNAIFIGEGGLYQPATGATVTRTYDDTKHVTTNTDIGKVTYTYNGGMAFAFLSMHILGVGVSTEDVDFPIPYNWDIVLENGEYELNSKIKFMPGATLRVGSNANLTVNGTLFVLDGLIQSDMSGKYYPNTEELQDEEFSASGQLIVNGTLNVKEGAAFGGIIQTEMGDGDSTIEIEAGANLNRQNIQDGGIGYYDVNTSTFDLPARAYIYDSAKGTYELKKVYPGRFYSSHDNSMWSVEDYTMTYAANCGETEHSPGLLSGNGKAYHKWVTETVPLNESRIGSWDTAGYVYHNVQVVNKTIYDETDSTRTVVGDDNSLGEIESCGDVVFTVDITETGIGYGYQVTYVAGNADPIVLTADAEGQYTISEVENDVTIIVTSCKLGDINLDGEIDNADLVQLRKTLAKILTPEDLQFIAADINRDGEIDNGDLVMLRKHLAKVIEIS